MFLNLYWLSKADVATDSVAIAMSQKKKIQAQSKLAKSTAKLKLWHYLVAKGATSRSESATTALEHQYLNYATNSTAISFHI